MAEEWFLESRLMQHNLKNRPTTKGRSMPYLPLGEKWDDYVRALENHIQKMEAELRETTFGMGAECAIIRKFINKELLGEQ